MSLARFRRGHGARLHARHEIAQHAAVADDPQHQRDHQPPVGLGEQVQRADHVQDDVPQRVHRLHGGIAQRAAGLHDAVGDAAGEVVVEERQPLAQHVAVILPAHQRGQAGRDGLVGQQVVRGDRQRAQHHHHHRHPQQQAGVALEELGGRRVARQVDDVGQEAEQRHLDQRARQSHHQQHGEDRPDLQQVVGVEAQHAAGRGDVRGVLERVYQAFETTEDGFVLDAGHG